MTKSKKEFIHYSAIKQRINIGDRVIMSFSWNGNLIRGRVIGLTPFFVKVLVNPKYGWVYYRKPHGIIVIDNKLGEF